MKIAKLVSYVVLGLASLCIYSYMVFMVSTKGVDSVPLGRGIKSFAIFPKQIQEVFHSKELAGLPATYMKRDSTFQEINNLNYDLFALNSFWNQENTNWEVRLFNFKDDKIVHQWYINEADLDYTTTDYSFSRTMPRTPILLDDKHLIVSCDESANLLRLDRDSKVVWKNNDFIFHHAMNPDIDSNIWTCTTPLMKNGKTSLKAIKRINGGQYEYNDESITLINKQNGQVLFNKSISEILIENGFQNFIYGFNDSDEMPADPMHLNDVEPALEDGQYWQKGDLFISLRHRSLVFLYRPSSNKILKLFFGPFLNQHDVDIISDSTIAIFNNNHICLESDSISHKTVEVVDSLESSEIIIYNFNNDEYSTHLNEYLLEEKIATDSQGMQHFLSNGDVYVECQNKGTVFVLNESGFLLKKTFSSPLEGYIYRPHWIRIIELLK